MNHLKSLLQDSISEIQRLRRENEILRAKVETMNLFAVLLHTAPAYPPQGAAIDVAWQLEKELNGIRQNEAKESVGEPASHILIDSPSKLEATHRCKVCGADFHQWQAGVWLRLSDHNCECCMNPGDSRHLAALERPAPSVTG